MEATESLSANICLRILDPKNKKSIKDSYQLRGITDVWSVGDLKMYIVENYGEQIGAADTANFDLGYYRPPRSMRFRITSDIELAKALSLKNHGWVLLWMIVHTQAKAPKRALPSSDDGTPGCSNPKVQCLHGNLVQVLIVQICIIFIQFCMVHESK